MRLAVDTKFPGYCSFTIQAVFTIQVEGIREAMKISADAILPSTDSSGDRAPRSS